jgi:hypothetical protein
VNKVLHSEELRNLYSSPNIVRMIKSRGMRLAGHVAQTGEKRNAYKILVGRLKGKFLSSCKIGDVAMQQPRDERKYYGRLLATAR